MHAQSSKATPSLAEIFFGSFANLFRARRAQRAPGRRFRLEALEPRILLSADLVGQELIFNAVANGAADDYTLRFNADSGDLEILDHETVVASQALAATSAVIINGEDGQDDNLTVDFDYGGFFSLASGITYNGGTDGIDKLTVTGGQFTSITHTYTEAGPGLSGNIVYEDGVHAPLTVAYTDLEPIDMTGSTATSLVFNLPGTNDIVNLEDAPGVGTSQLRSGNATFETTIFSSTATSVTINMGAGDDSMVVRSLPDYHGALTINGNTGADTVLFSGTDSLSSLAVNVAGGISDATFSSITVIGNASLAGSSIDLNDVFSAGSLTFNSIGAVSISEDGATTLAGSSTAGSLSLNVFDALSDAAGATVGVSGNATVSAFSVFIADQTSNAFIVGGNAFFDTPLFLTVGANGVTNFGTLRFSSSGQVFVVEDSDTVLTGASSADSALLTSFGSLTDAAGTSLSVADFADLHAGTGITLGDNAADITNFGTLTFSSPGAVTIAEDSDSVLSGTNSASSLALTSAGSITDAAGGVNVTVNGAASFRGASISLADGSSDFWTLNGSVSFSTNSGSGDITIAQPGRVQLGSLNFNTLGNVAIFEDSFVGTTSGTTLSGNSTAGSLALTSEGAAAAPGIADAGAHLSVGGNATFTLVNGGGQIALTDFSDESLSVGGIATFNAIAALGGNVTVAAAGSVSLGSVAFTGNAVSITEDNDLMLAAGASSANILTLASPGQITDAAGAQVTVSGNATLQGSSIFLTDSSTDIFSVSGTASLTAVAGGAITINPQGAANFNSLAVNAGGQVVITEDSASNFTGGSSVGSLTLTSAGAITDDGATITVTGLATLSGSSITLGNPVASRTNFGTLSFTSPGAVSISEGSAMTLTQFATAGSLTLASNGALSDNPGVNISVTGAARLSGASITLGDNGLDLVNFGSLSFNAVGGAVSIVEDSDVTLTGLGNSADSLSLTAAGSIQDSPDTALVVRLAVALSGTSITLGDNPGDTTNFGTLTFNSPGAVSIAEDSDLLLTGSNTASAVTLASPGLLGVNGSLDTGKGAISLAGSSVSFGAFSTLNVDIGGTGTGNFTQVTVSGALFLEGGALDVDLVNGFAPASGDRFRFMTFPSRTGFFFAADLPANFNVDQSDPTDLELVFAPAAPGIVYVDDDFTGAAGTVIVDADPVAAGNQAAVVGFNAFATIQAGANAVAQGGTVKINSHGPNASPTGAYAESVSITKALTLDGNATSGQAADVVIDPAAGNGITVSGTAADNLTIRDLRVTGGIDGINATGLGDVTIINVTADGNENNGINLTSVGAVTAQRVIDSGNLNTGMRVSEAASFSDSSGIYTGNNNHGIQLIDIAGLVSLTNVTANDNDANVGGIGDGVNLIDGADAGTEAIGSLQVFGGSFSDTVAAGVQRYGIRVGDGIGIGAVHSVGGAVVIDATVLGNRNSGVEIEDGGTTASVSGAYLNNLGSGITLASLSGSFTASGVFSLNGSDGLSLIDVDGAVTLANVTVNDNGGNGLNAVDGDDGGTLALGGLTVSGGSFNDTAGGNAQLSGVVVGDVNGDVVFASAGASGNAAGGVRIGAVSGSVTFGSGAGASYSSNGGDGVNIASLTGTLTMSGVSASNNAGQGLVIGAGATAASIGNGAFNANTGGDGISLGTVSGAVVLSGVTASANLDAGVSVNGAASFSDSSGSYTGNNNHGIQLIDIAGLVSLSFTTANDNDANVGGVGDGVNLIDGADAGTEAIGSLQVIGGNFSDTGAAGVQRYGIRVGDGVGIGAVHSVGGAVLIQEASVIGNRNSGVEIEDGGTTASVSGTYANNLGTGITLASLSSSFTASGVFALNGSDGLSLIDVDGAVTLTNVTASDNGGNGLNAVDGGDTGTLAVGGLTVSSGSFNNTAGGNAQLSGVVVGDVNGDVLFADAGASGNTAGGVRIGAVSGSVAFGSNAGVSYSSNGGDGVNIASLTGTLTLSRVSASDNAGQGLVIGAGATAVSIGNGAFNANTGGDGISLGTVSGAVVLSGVTASANLDAGVSVNGAASFADSSGIYTGNNNHGIQLIDIAGLVSLTNVTANDNDANVGGIGDGVNLIDGADAGTEAIGSLQVIGGSFSDTVAAGVQRYGIRVGDGVGVGAVHSVGTSVVLDGVTATGNRNSGVEIEDGGTTASVSGSYDGNLGTGFTITSLSGSLTASGASFSNNGANGIFAGDIGEDVVFADEGTTANMVTGNGLGGVDLGNVMGSVTFASSHGASYSGNLGGDGINVDSLTGALTVSGITSSGNAGDGLEVGAAGTGATLVDATFSNNAGGGVALNALGSAFSGDLVLSGVSANGNSLDGVNAHNLNGASTTVTGGAFNGNGDDGLDLAGAGALSLTDVVTNGNGDAGLVVNAALSFSDTDGVHSGNSNHGIQLVDIAGLVSLTSVTANDNDANVGGIGDGVNLIDGADAGTEAIGSLQVIGGSFGDTAAPGVQRYGIRVGDGLGVGAVHSVGGTVVLQDVSITGNRNSGVEIEDGGTTASVSGTYSNNLGTGITMASLSGAIHLGDVTAVNNGDDAANLSTAGTITIAGTLDAGTDNVALTAAGGVAVDSGAVLLVDLAGTAAGQFTTFTISGAVTLDGTLEAELVGGFLPADDDRFEFMTFASRSGFFSTLDLPAEFVVEENPTSLELVFSPNQAPVATGDAYTTAEDTALVVAAPGVLGNDTDADHDALSAELLTGPAHGTLTFNANGSFTYTPTANFYGSDSFTYRVSDGEDNSGAATVNLTVTPVNDAPVFQHVGPQTVEEGRQLRFTVNATDIDSPILTYTASGLPAGATFNPTTHEFVWTPQDDASTAVTFTVSDGQGGQDVMTVALKATNVAPTLEAGADQVVGLQDIKDHDHDKDDKHCDDKDKPEAEVRIAAVFDDPGLRDTHTATIDWGDGSATAAGKVIEPTATVDGAVTGKHTYTKAGTYTVTVTVKDDDGGMRSDTLLITVKQPAEKKNFDAKGDEYKLNEDSVLTVDAPHGVLDNDRGPIGVTLQARVVEGPEHGKLLFNANGSFTYVPNADFHGKDSFWYEFTDGSNVSKAVEVKLDVKEVKGRHSRPCIDWDDRWRAGWWCDEFRPVGKHWG